ncbi:MAG: hypothetical protein OXT67_08370, partial [Zetaproteobacteria bacterium]|nr:hypothetical protein [Zetaproteobacteria bacterium]
RPEEKVAILLVALGEKLAGDILSKLPSKERKKLVHALSHLSKISETDVTQVLHEFEQALKTTASHLHGGGTHFRTMLQKSGHYKTEWEDDICRLSALNHIPTDKITRLICHEHPQTIAAILVLIDTERAAKILHQLSPNLATEVIQKIAHMRSLSHDSIEVLNTSIELQLQKTSSTQRIHKGGTGKVAELLSSLSTAESQHLLAGMAQHNEQLTQQIQQQVFKFKDLCQLPQVAWPTLARAIAQSIWLQALRTNAEDIKLIYLQQLSQRNAKLFQEDLRSSPPIKMTEIEKAQQKILETAWNMHQEGKIPWIGETYV